MKKLNENKSILYLFVLFFTILATNLSAQVEVDVNSDVWIGANVGAPNPNNSALNVFGRMSMRYPGPFFSNILIGDNVGNPSMTGSGNIGIGVNNGQNFTSGVGNILLGKWAGQNITSGNSNVVVGPIAGVKLTNSQYNSFLGVGAGNNFATIGSSVPEHNIAIGWHAGAKDTGPDLSCSGSGNILIGRTAGGFIQGGASNNIMIGHQAGKNCSGSTNIFLGYKAGQNETGSNLLYIDNSDTATPLIYGNFTSNLVRINGDFDVTGTLTAAVKNFKIDHPLYPEKKNLVFASIEAPEMINMFRGNITTDEKGYATVSLPDYFETANIEYSYHLTCIGVFAQAIVSQEIERNKFVIQTDQPGVKVSWQVLAKRNDTWAQEHPLVVEQEKE